MTKSPKSLLSEITFLRTYAKVKEDGTKESWENVVDRYCAFLKTQLPRAGAYLVDECRPYILSKKVVGSMRLMQFAGDAVHREHARAYNCSFMHMKSFQAAAELLYLAACGVGVGYSIQRRHTELCTNIGERVEGEVYAIPDTREGWADSIVMLLENPALEFDYALIRPFGAPLSTGGTASGPAPLQQCHERIKAVIGDASGRKLTPFEWHVVLTSIGDAIVSGGVRRTALIALFDIDDQEMLNCKSGMWWEKYPQFARANNSAVFNRKENSKEQFDAVLDACFASNAGEPGLVVTNNNDWGLNPCAEIALKSNQFCNLCDVNVSRIEDHEEFIKMVKVAAILGTIQSKLDSFGYLNPEWKKNCEEERLLGISLTGQAQNWDLIKNPEVLKVAAEEAKKVNEFVAKLLGINPAARITTTKPSGTTSVVLETSSGVHAVHAPFYIRRVGVDRFSPLGQELYAQLGGTEFLTECSYDKALYLLCLPIKMKGINRLDESAIALLQRMKHLNKSWIQPGHVSGDNSHNISLTVSYKQNEIHNIKQWMWTNRYSYSGISLLPFDNGTYTDAPYEEITEAQYNEMVAKLPNVDVSNVKYSQSDDERNSESACAGGLCELPNPGESK